MINGLEKGIKGMCEGEIRRILIPSDMGKQIRVSLFL